MTGSRARPTAGRSPRQDVATLLDFYAARQRGRPRLRARHPACARAHLERPRVPVPRRGPLRARAGHGLSRRRRDARFAARAIPLEQHPGRRAARDGDRRAAARAERARGAGAQDARATRAPARSSTNFAEQWLQLRNIAAKAPDLLEFPDWDDNLRKDMLRETELLLHDVLLGDASVLDLIGADYSFMNERLAAHYGIDGVFGDAFRRVTLTDPNRRGSARSRQHSVRDVRRHAHVARVSRQVDHDEHLQLAAEPAAGERAGARGQRGRRRAAHGARAARAASRRPGRARAATSRWTRRASRSRTSTRSAAGAAPRRAVRSTRAARSRTARRSSGRARCAKPS